jgi:predicted dienelactone hydrolase
MVVTAAVAVVGALGAPAPASAASSTHAVGMTTETFVDTSRPTAANGSCPEIPSRTLPTTIYYPAVGDATSATPQPDAAPDTAGGPYPLIVFAHGYGGTPQNYEALLAQWASAGYVVAAPTFPLSSATSPCGAVAGDSINQPADLSVVITSVLRENDRDGSALTGLVDKKEIGAAGHSNGGITMYGLVANTEARDKRVRAVAILAGTPQVYPKGKYDFTKVPPILLVHGSADAQVPYDAAVGAFNKVRGPKGLLTITGGDHGSAASTSLAGAATTDFFDAYLRGDKAAQSRLPGDQTAGASTMKFVAKQGATVTIPTTAPPTLHLKASVTPHANLTNGQLVTVKWSGYTAGKAINILQCNASNRDLANSAACAYSQGGLLHANPTGEGTLQLAIIEGPVGDGICDGAHPGCFILVNNASSTDPKDSRFLDITFAK